MLSLEEHVGEIRAAIVALDEVKLERSDVSVISDRFRDEAIKLFRGRRQFPEAVLVEALHQAVKDTVDGEFLEEVQNRAKDILLDDLRSGHDACKCHRLELGDMTEEEREKCFSTEDPGGVETTDLYWDCECKFGYIHPRGKAHCDRCGALREEQPCSRVRELTGKHRLSEEVSITGCLQDGEVYCSSCASLPEHPDTKVIVSGSDFLECCCCGREVTAVRDALPI